MFERPGERVKSFATILFVIHVIGGLIGGIVAAIELDSFWYSLPIWFVTVIVGYVICLFLYGFGELVENSKMTADGTSEILKTLAREAKKKQKEQEESAPERVPAPTAVDPSLKAEETEAKREAANEPSISSSNEPFVILPEKPGYIRCTSCGTVQREDRNLCFQCGSVFHKTQS